jgi:hypothetical protein
MSPIRAGASYGNPPTRQLGVAGRLWHTEPADLYRFGLMDRPTLSRAKSAFGAARCATAWELDHCM